MAEPERKSAGLRWGWLRKLLYPCRRKAVRRAAPEMEAYYFDGAAPSKRDVRDISSTGLYLLTHERWYPGTLVDIALQREGDSERAVIVRSRVVRSGEDGVGFEFIFSRGGASNGSIEERQDLAGPKDLRRFLDKSQGNGRIQGMPLAQRQ